MTGLMEQMAAVCREYAGPRCYAAPLPAKLSPRIGSRFAIPDKEAVFAFFDCSLTGNGGDGVAFTESGLYWKSFWGSAVHIPWEELAGGAIHSASRKGWIVLGRSSYNLSGCALSAGEFAVLLKRLCLLLPLPDQERHIEIAQEQRLDRAWEERSPVLDQAFLTMVCKSHSYFDKIRDYATGSPRRSSISPDAFNLSPDEKIIAFNDLGWKKEGRVGVAVTDFGICLRIKVSSASHYSGVFISYGKLPVSGISQPKRGQTAFGLDIIYTGVDAGPLAAMLTDIQLYAASLLIPAHPLSYPYNNTYIEPWTLPVRAGGSARWIVAEDGMPRGIHSMEELQWAADSGQLDADMTLLWTEGMSQWLTAEQAGLRFKS